MTQPASSPTSQEPAGTNAAGPSATQPPIPSAFATLWPYLAAFRTRVLLAVLLLVTAKLANIGVPLVMKQIVDSLTPAAGLVAVPFMLLLAYGLLRLSATLFAELRDMLFVKVTQNAMRQVALQVFRHLHSLSLRFHLERQTGGLTRDVERGTRAISTLMSYMLFSVVPTVFEITLVAILLGVKFDAWFSVITIAAIVAYCFTTFAISEWRTAHRRQMNDMDSKANTRAIDSLINYETVKYFGNEQFEAKRYDESLQRLETAASKSEMSLGLLNTAQSLIIATTVTLLMWRASEGIVAKSMTLGDLVMVNALLIQLYIPLNFFGVMYREIKQALTDMEKMFRLLYQHREVEDAPGAKPIDLMHTDVRFEAVNFGYDGKRQILHDASFVIPSGKTLAVVGASGAGKSTLSRLLYRFYDVGFNDVAAGRISIGGQDIRSVTQASLRQAIGIVPQDTVLFNDSIFYNIAYGRPEATREEVIETAKLAHIHDFIEALPEQYSTPVGERGLKLSGGEKQRVAIARTLLKRPAILIFDEATSALDSRTEKAIQAELKEISANRTTLIIAHRLSTIVDADQIIVMDAGRIAEQGSFAELMAANGAFAQMWRLQPDERRGQDIQIIV
jgi:ATP-binding cassette, subfamily B, heavy metal transporter